MSKYTIYEDTNVVNDESDNKRYKIYVDLKEGTTLDQYYNNQHGTDYLTQIDSAHDNKTGWEWTFCSASALATCLSLYYQDLSIDQMDFYNSFYNGGGELAYWGSKSDNILVNPSEGDEDSPYILRGENDAPLIDENKNFIRDTEGMNEYLNQIQEYLKCGIPVIVRVNRVDETYPSDGQHFITIVGINESADINGTISWSDLVMIDSGTGQDEYKISLVEDGYIRPSTGKNVIYEPANFRIIAPFVTDPDHNLILDETGKPTSDLGVYVDYMEEHHPELLPEPEIPLELEPEPEPEPEPPLAPEPPTNNPLQDLLNSLIADEGNIRDEIEEIGDPDNTAEIEKLKGLNELLRILEALRNPPESTVSETTREYYQIQAQQALFHQAEDGFATAHVVVDPLVVDLDGNGFETTGQADGVYFDLDNNGFAEKTSWISGGNDGFIALDLNENGIIDNGTELFGNYTKLSSGKLAKNGFEALSQYDKNADGKIDENDEVYDKLQVWVDNGNGTTENSELHSLSELGIASIGLTQRADETGEYLEATVSGISDAETSDGNATTVADFWFENSKSDTKYIVTDEIAEEISKLPDVRSMGKVPSLHAAMAMDESGELTDLVASFVNSLSESEKRGILTNILYKITDAENVAVNSRGAYINARDLHVIESMLGDKFVALNGNPDANATAVLNKLYSDLSDSYYALLVESSISDYLNLIDFTEVNGNLSIDASLFNQCITIVDKLGGDVGSILSSVSSYIKYIDVTEKNYTNFYLYYINNNSSLLKHLPTDSDMIFGDDTSETISSSVASSFYGLGGNDRIEDKSGKNSTLVGGKGDDRIYGDCGADTYIYNLGDGHDRYNEFLYSYDYNTNDKVKFGENINAEDIVYKRSGSHLVMEINESDSVTVEYFFYGTINQIEYFEFADGTVLDIDDIKERTNYVKGTEGNDTIKAFTDGINFDLDQTLYGLGGNDTIEDTPGRNATIIGGEGNDTLYGEGGNDTYIFNLGDGKDYIDEYHTLNNNAKYDRIIFGEGILADEIEFKRVYTNLIITVNENDSVNIEGQYFNDYHQIEYFEFADGTVLNINDIEERTNYVKGTEGDDTVSPFTSGINFDFDQTLYGFGGNDTLHGNISNDTYIGGTGNDNLYGGRGNDTYIFNIGDGQDIIDDYNYGYSDEDKVVFGEGIKAEDVIFSRTGTDLNIQFAGTEDSITVKCQFNATNWRMDSFETSDGSLLTYTNIELLIQAMAEFTSDTGITAEEAAVTDNQTYSDIVNQMWVQA
jgi:Ca2+-binding RTX toxin-like protein